MTNAQNDDKIPLCLPYISDALCTAERAALRRHDLDRVVRVVNISPRNLKQQPVRNRL